MPHRGSHVCGCPRLCGPMLDVQHSLEIFPLACFLILFPLLLASLAYLFDFSTLFTNFPILNLNLNFKLDKQTKPSESEFSCLGLSFQLELQDLTFESFQRMQRAFAKWERRGGTKWDVPRWDSRPKWT